MNAHQNQHTNVGKEKFFSPKLSGKDWKKKNIKTPWSLVYSKNKSKTAQKKQIQQQKKPQVSKVENKPKVYNLDPAILADHKAINCNCYICKTYGSQNNKTTNNTSKESVRISQHNFFL